MAEWTYPTYTLEEHRAANGIEIDDKSGLTVLVDNGEQQGRFGFRRTGAMVWLVDQQGQAASRQYQTFRAVRRPTDSEEDVFLLLGKHGADIDVLSAPTDNPSFSVLFADVRDVVYQADLGERILFTSEGAPYIGDMDGSKIRGNSEFLYTPDGQLYTEGDHVLESVNLSNIVGREAPRMRLVQKGN